MGCPQRATNTLSTSLWGQSGTRSPAVWRRRMAILAALTLPECSVLGQVKLMITPKRGWQVTSGRLCFRRLDGEQEEQGVPSIELANMAITYAREMEQIV